MPVPITAKQGYIDPLIKQRIDQGKPVGVATANEEYIARYSGRFVFRPWPMNIRIVPKWQKMNVADATATKFVDVRLPRREDCVVGRERRQEPFSPLRRAPWVIRGIVDDFHAKAAEVFKMRSVKWSKSGGYYDIGARFLAGVEDLRAKFLKM